MSSHQQSPSSSPSITPIAETTTTTIFATGGGSASASTATTTPTTPSSSTSMLGSSSFQGIFAKPSLLSTAASARSLSGSVLVGGGGSLIGGATTSAAAAAAVATSTTTTLTSSSMKSSSENLPPRTLARVARDVRDLVNAPPEGVRLLLDGETGMPGSLSEIVAEIEGPEQTPYHTYYFQLKLVISSDFPHAPPRGYFLTKIYHPNVDPTTGAICVNTLKSDWTPTTSLSHVLKVIRCLLIVPFPESSLNDEAGKNFMDSYEEYARRAKLLAGVHGLTSWSCGGNNTTSTTTTTIAGEGGVSASSSGVVVGKSEGLNNEDGMTMVDNGNSHLPNGSSSSSNHGHKLGKMGSRSNVVNRASSKSLEKKKSLRRL